MNIFHKRHLALFCTIFAVASLCGCVLSYNLKASVLSFLGIVALLTLLSVLFVKRYRAIFLKCFLCVLFAFTALISQFLRVDVPIHKITPHFNQVVDITATVTRVNFNKDYLSSCYVDISSINGNASPASAVLECEYNAELEVGNVISGTFVIDKIENYTEIPSYLKSKGITLFLQPSQNFELSHNRETPSMKLKKINSDLSDIFTDRIDDESGKLVSALMLGNKELLHDSTIRDFRRAGVSHILAISGMHLSILIFFFDFILKKLRLSKVLRGSITIFAALFYLALTGFSLSTARAFLMSSIVYLAYILQDENDMLTTLLFSLFIILAASPLSVYDVGMWLSFLAVLGIFASQYFIEKFNLLLYKKPKSNDTYDKKRKRNLLAPKLKKISAYIFSTVCITVFVNIFICVPMCLFFDEFSLASIISNIVSTPVVTLILFLAPLLIVLNIVEPIAGVIAQAVEFLCGILIDIIEFISSFEKITVSLHYPFVKNIVWILAILLSVCLVFKFKHKWLIVIPPIISALMFSAGLAVDTMCYNNLVQVEYIGENESEAILIRDGSDYSIIDMSTGGYIHSYSTYTKSVENCATEISSYVITHYHNYHATTLHRLLNKTIVRTLFLPYPQDIKEYYAMSSIITAAENAKTDVILYDSLSDIKITPNTTFNLSGRAYLKRSTHPTFYFSISAYGRKLVYMAESANEHKSLKNEVDNELKDAEILILGAHGPKTKNDFNCDTFYSTQPVISANQEIFDFFTSVLPTVSDVTYAKIYLTKY